jgi:sterol desaturase/sphingolipid hydroxylase (fatty acid hydroxylase superfamily)
MGVIMLPDLALPALLAFVILVQLARTAVITGTVLALVRSPLGARRRVFALGSDPGQIASEVRATVVVILFDAAVFTALHLSGVLRTASGVGLGEVLLTAAAAFVWFELWFYALHRLMHTRWLFAVHRQHHTARVTTPFTALSFSLAERSMLLLGILLPAVLIAQVHPLASGGLLLYGVANYALNVAGHANVDLAPSWWQRIPGTAWLVTPSWHSLHHARHHGHFGLFTTVLDRWCGTEFRDARAVQQRVLDGRPLTRLGERIELVDAEHVKITAA